MPSLSEMTAISFTRPMFTARNVFSRIFASSATSGDDTSTTWSITSAYSATARWWQLFVRPPTILGVFATPHVGLAGSTRSGLNATKKSDPALRPDASSAGVTRSRVVPG